MRPVSPGFKPHNVDSPIIIHAIRMIHDRAEHYACTALKQSAMELPGNIIDPVMYERGEVLAQHFAELFYPTSPPQWLTVEQIALRGYFGSPRLDDPRGKTSSLVNGWAYELRETALGLFLAMITNPQE